MTRFERAATTGTVDAIDMKRVASISALFLLLAGFPIGAVGGENDTDSRLSLQLTPSEESQFLSEMRQMLASIQGILAGIGSEDRELIARSARTSGNRMARATPDTVRQKLPEAFKELGGPTHLMFEELAIRAETDDMSSLAEFTGQLMHQCLNCHASFKTN